MPGSAIYDLGIAEGRKALETVISEHLRTQYPSEDMHFTCTAQDDTPIFIALVPRLSHIPNAYGAFASRRIAKGEEFIYAGKRLTNKEASAARTEYLYELSRDVVEDCEEIGNATRFVNHSAQYFNLYPEIRETPEGKEYIAYIALRDIEPGEQLLIHYGPSYNYPEGLVYLHPSDGHRASEDLIRTFQLAPRLLSLTIKDKHRVGEYYLSPLCQAILDDKKLPLMAGEAAALSVHLMKVDASSLGYISPLMLAVALGRTAHTAILLAQADSLNLDLIGMVDEEHDDALHYALYHQRPDCAALILEVIERQIDKAIKAKNEFLILQARHLLILQNKHELSPLHLAVKFHDYQAIEKLLQLFKKLSAFPLGTLCGMVQKDPFVLVDNDNLCPLLLAIKNNDWLAIKRFTMFIQENDWVIYNKKRKNPDINHEEAVENYANAFSCLHPSMIELVLEALHASVNLFNDRKFNVKLLKALTLKSPEKAGEFLDVAARIGIISHKEKAELATPRPPKSARSSELGLFASAAIQDRRKRRFDEREASMTGIDRTTVLASGHPVAVHGEATKIVVTELPPDASTLTSVGQVVAEPFSHLEERPLAASLRFFPTWDLPSLLPQLWRNPPQPFFPTFR
ncbi:SET domain-containing protein-lysine N-methyltransferase [Legionella nagasakiensis]|uniref:SET domain-containing protein-lysine N-methyltransferase n=1 Tax=Legionella nagasakiensis TaxID=535290 RepID=UPI001055E280|nr:SET domain-containing protein-lysine N-methyltransferase [Legionella nagasakiensis]